MVVRVSVIIPIYNGAADVPDLLRTLQAQTMGDQAEYLVVDNNSQDETLAMLQAAIATFAQQGVSLRVLQEVAVQSSYAARNTGIRAAQADILAFTDADCRPEPTWLEQLLRPFQADQVGLVAGEIKALPGVTWLEDHAEHHETLSQKHTLAHPFRPYGQTANLAVRRSLFQQVGLFRPALTTGGDADFCWRALADPQVTLEFAPAAIVRHRHRATLSDLMSQWRRYGRSNRYLHELHGVPLMQPVAIADQARSWLRWLLKELPRGTAQLIGGKRTIAAALGTPIAWLCNRARWEGQRMAVLPPAARDIAWLDAPDVPTAAPDPSAAADG